MLRWRTARPLTLHPAKVVRASIIPPASWMPAAAQGVPGVLCLRIEGIAGLSLAKFGLPSLSLHLGGDRFATFPMHEWVHGAVSYTHLRLEHIDARVLAWHPSAGTDPLVSRCV